MEDTSVMFIVWSLQRIGFIIQISESKKVWKWCQKKQSFNCLTTSNFDFTECTNFKNDWRERKMKQMVCLILCIIKRGFFYRKGMRWGNSSMCEKTFITFLARTVLIPVYLSNTLFIIWISGFPLLITIISLFKVYCKHIFSNQLL